MNAERVTSRIDNHKYFPAIFMHNYSFRYLLLLGASATILIGCSAAAPDEPLIRMPGNGSVFMYTNYATDSNTNKIAASETQTTRIIINTNAMVADSSWVVQFLEAKHTRDEAMNQCWVESMLVRGSTPQR